MTTLIEVRNLVIESMKEAALASTIDNRMVDEINALYTNGFNTKELFGMSAMEFLSPRWDMLPLDTRVAFFDMLA